MKGDGGTVALHKGSRMNNDTPVFGLAVVPDATDLDALDPVMIQAFVEQRSDMARRWLAQAYHLMQADETDTNAVLVAICAANDNLAPLEALGPIFAGVAAGIDELKSQRDQAVEDYEQLEEKLEERVRREVDRGLSEALAQAFATEDDAEDAEIELLARQMVEGDESDVIAEATRLLASKLRSARERAQWYRENGLPGEEYTEAIEEDDDE